MYRAMNFGFGTSTFLCVLLALASAFAPRVEADDSDSDLPPALGIVKNSGFCRNGVWGETRWPGGMRPGGLQVWGSFCGKGNDDVGRAESQEFLAPAALHLYLAGYPGLPGRRLMLKNVQSGEERELTPRFQPREEWHFDSLPVPPEWIGKQVQFVAEDQATGPAGWLGFSLPILTAQALTAIDTDEPQGGFCRDGVYPTTKWPAGMRPKGITTWGSYCKSGDKDTGWAASPPVNADADINIYIAGYPDTAGLSLAVENVQRSLQIPLRVPKAPGELWNRYHFALPAGWKGQLVRVIGRDQATGIAGWLAFSEPVPATLADKARIAAKTLGLVLLFTALLLVVPFAVCRMVKLRGENNALYLAITALLTLGSVLLIDFCSRLTAPDNGVIAGSAGFLVVCAIVAYFAFGKDRGSGLLRTSPDTPQEGSTGLIRTPGQRRLVLIVTWGLTALAILPAIFHWVAPPPFTGSDRYVLTGLGYLAAFGICYGIYRAESRRLSRPQTIVLVFLVFLLTSIVNNVHSYYVDQVTRYFAEPNRVGQSTLQDSVIQLVPLPPHSYRFLPNAIVRWMQLAHMDFDSARDLYRLLTGLLLFYAIYKYARLYCNYTGAIIALLFTAMIYPVGFEYYAGQLTDPLSHLSFVLAFIFLETEEFALLLSTLVIGSLAKETVLAMAGYYVLFCRKERHYTLKAAALSLASVGAYFGVRRFVLHGAMHYQQASGVTLNQVWDNLQNLEWQTPFLLTACALLPFLALGWKETPLSLKRLAAFLLPVLFISSLFFSWLRETRNYMPLVFVLAVVAGGYLSRQLRDAPKVETRLEIEAVSGD